MGKKIMEKNISLPDYIKLARELDKKDVLASFRNDFHIPKSMDYEQIYLCGNSLGLQPINVEKKLDVVLEQWKSMGVHGHFKGDCPWLELQDKVINKILTLVGAHQDEVVLMNALTVNIHLMLETFFQPTKTRFKILVEDNIFPSDLYALQSQCKRHGLDPNVAIIKIKNKNFIYNMDDIEEILNIHGEQIALVFLPGVQYISGQVFDMEYITKISKQKGCKVGWDLAHAIGNIHLNCHKWNFDFAVWCNYKYMNSGPGAVGGVFIHKDNINKNALRMQGWWGLSHEERFNMTPEFIPENNAKSWQISNPPVMSLAILDASLDIFNKVDFDVLIKKSEQLWNYTLDFLQNKIKSIDCITPSNSMFHGCQMSLRLQNKSGKEILTRLYEKRVVADWRGEDILRFAPVPLYNTFDDCHKFVNILHEIIKE
jgi:kynureninase